MCHDVQPTINRVNGGVVQRRWASRVGRGRGQLHGVYVTPARAREAHDGEAEEHDGDGTRGEGHEGDV